MTLTKSDLVDHAYQIIDLKKADVCALVESILEIIKAALEDGESVLISGFGKFEIRDKRRRKGRNPQTGADQMLDARRVVTFKCSAVLREKMNHTE